MTETSSRTPANKPDLSLEEPCALVPPKVQEWCQMGGEDCLSRMGEPCVNDAIRNVDIMKQAKDNQDTRLLFRPDSINSCALYQNSTREMS
jgi:hypothetical protein